MNFPPVEGEGWAVVGLSGTHDQWLHTVQPILMPAAAYLAQQNLTLTPTTSTAVGVAATLEASAAPLPNSVGAFETKGCERSPPPEAVSMTRDTVLQKSLQRPPAVDCNTPTAVLKCGNCNTLFMYPASAAHVLCPSCNTLTVLGTGYSMVAQVVSQTQYSMVAQVVPQTQYSMAAQVVPQTQYSMAGQVVPQNRAPQVVVENLTLAATTSTAAPAVDGPPTVEPRLEPSSTAHGQSSVAVGNEEGGSATAEVTVDSLQNEVRIAIESQPPPAETCSELSEQQLGAEKKPLKKKRKRTKKKHLSQVEGAAAEGNHESRTRKKRHSQVEGAAAEGNHEPRGGEDEAHRHHEKKGRRTHGGKGGGSIRKGGHKESHRKHH